MLWKTSRQLLINISRAILLKNSPYISKTNKKPSTFTNTHGGDLKQARYLPNYKRIIVFSSNLLYEETYYLTFYSDSYA